MPNEIERKVTTTSSGPVSDQTSQTATSTEVPTKSEKQDLKSDRGNAWVWYIVGIVDLLILLRGLFHLFGARSAGFTDFLYAVTGPFVAPFRGIFQNPTVDGSYFETASLVAIIVYLLLGWVIVKLIDLATRPANSNKV